MKCENCKSEFVGESWKKLCAKCYAKGKTTENSKRQETSNIPTTDKLIVRQVLYKVAAELLEKGTPAAKVNEYVKQLEVGFYQ